MSIKEKAEKLIKSMPDGDRLGIIDVAKAYLDQQTTIDILVEGFENMRKEVSIRPVIHAHDIHQLINDTLRKVGR